MNKYNFYGIVGSNGYGIVTSWGKCSKSLHYFKKAITKGFYTLDECYDWVYCEFMSRYGYYGYDFVDMHRLAQIKLHFLKNVIYEDNYSSDVYEVELVGINSTKKDNNTCY